MSDSRKSPTYEYAENPVYFNQLHDEIGRAQLSEMLGYTVSSISQMRSGTKKIRRFVEFACEQYIENQLKKEREDHIFIFLAKRESEQFKTLQTVAKAIGIEFQSL